MRGQDRLGPTLSRAMRRKDLAHARLVARPAVRHGTGWLRVLAAPGRRWVGPLHRWSRGLSGHRSIRPARAPNGTAIRRRWLLVESFAGWWPLARHNVGLPR